MKKREYGHYDNRNISPFQLILMTKEGVIHKFYRSPQK